MTKDGQESHYMSAMTGRKRDKICLNLVLRMGVVHQNPFSPEYHLQPEPRKVWTRTVE